MIYKLQLPQEFIVRVEVYGFGPNLERIPPDSVVLALSRSTYKRMIEIVWQEKRYIVFERDLHERMWPLKKPEPEDDPVFGT